MVSWWTRFLVAINILGKTSYVLVIADVLYCVLVQLVVTAIVSRISLELFRVHSLGQKNVEKDLQRAFDIKFTTVSTCTFSWHFAHTNTHTHKHLQPRVPLPCFYLSSDRPEYHFCARVVLGRYFEKGGGTSPNWEILPCVELSSVIRWALWTPLDCWSEWDIDKIDRIRVGDREAKRYTVTRAEALLVWIRKLFSNPDNEFFEHD